MATHVTPTPHATPFALPHALLAPAVSGPVLLACDGHAPTDAAAVAARRVAEKLGTRLDVLAVLDPVPELAGPYLPALVPPEFQAQRRAELEATVTARLEPVLGSREGWHLQVEYGPVGRTIASVARERGAGLVVLGSGGHRTRDRLLGEDVALTVVRNAPCPVLAVAAGFEAPVRRAVVGVDFSAASMRAALAALALLEPAADAPAKLVLVHVRSPFDLGYQVLERWAQQYDGVAAERFVHLRATLRPHVPDGVTVETRHRLGAVPATILETADELDAQLVAVGTHGPGWVERLFLGSAAEGTLRHAARSVLVTPPPNAIDRVRLELGVAGEVALDDAAKWAAALQAFTQRNAGRPVRLDVRDRASDLLRTESLGYPFVGAAYDAHDGRVELMLGDDPARARRLTHTIPSVRTIEIIAHGDGRRDGLLVVTDARGETVLTFVDERPV